VRPDTWLHPNASPNVRFLLHRGRRPYMALIFPLLLWSDRLGGATGKGRSAALVYTSTAVILVFGLYWLIERTVFA
jgi:hypothetical protein